MTNPFEKPPIEQKESKEREMSPKEAHETKVEISSFLEDLEEEQDRIEAELAELRTTSPDSEEIVELEESLSFIREQLELGEGFDEDMFEVEEVVVTKKPDGWEG